MTDQPNNQAAPQEPPQAPQAAPEPVPAPEAAEADKKLYRDAQRMLATLDQHSSELQTISAMLLLQIFAIGALAGVLFLSHKRLVEVHHALAG